MAPDETAEAALLHARELPHEFLTRFGPGFLSRYYRAFVESPYAVALVASANDTGRMDGVLIGTFDTGAHYSYLVRRHGPGLALSTLRQVSRDPRLAGKLIRTRLVRYLRGILRSLGYAVGAGAKTESSQGRDRVGFVAYVAVDRERRGNGIGGRLFETFEELAREAGLQRLELGCTPTCVAHPATYLNKVLVGSAEGGLQLWNVATGKRIYAFQGWGSAVTCVAPSPASSCSSSSWATSSAPGSTRCSA